MTIEQLEQLPPPEGYKSEVVDGNVLMTPRRTVHWQLIRRILWALDDRFGRHTNVLSEVPVRFPGPHSYCPAIAKLRDDAKTDSEGRWHPADIEFVTEIISTRSAQHAHGPKKAAYAKAKIPVYLVIDLDESKCHAYTAPKDGDYTTMTTVTFGTDVDLTQTPLNLTLKSADFPRD
ncbi:MAG: Uma2 family endonuclease [Streptomyces sp.]|nr:Uma2 family endonuclease [Streptomyces sp.]